MDCPAELTLEKFQVLKLVDEISQKSNFGIAPVKQLIDIITSQRNITSIAVRKMVWELSKAGYLENPLRGCWRLTKKGKQALKEVMGSESSNSQDEGRLQGDDE